MIPYGLYVLTAASKDGKVAAATIKLGDAGLVRAAARRRGRQGRFGDLPRAQRVGTFALNVLGKGQGGIATNSFKPTQQEGKTINTTLALGDLGERVFYGG